jgi:hypothetical protein
LNGLFVVLIRDILFPLLGVESRWSDSKARQHINQIYLFNTFDWFPLSEQRTYRKHRPAGPMSRNDSQGSAARYSDRSRTLLFVAATILLHSRNIRVTHKIFVRQRKKTAIRRWPFLLLKPGRIRLPVSFRVAT